MRHPHLLILIIILSLLLAACGTETASPTDPPVTAEPIPSTTPTLTLTPTATSIPPALYLLAPPDADPQLAGQVEPILQEAAQQAGLSYKRVPNLNAAEIPPDAALVVVIPPGSAIDLASSAPETTFISIGFGYNGSPDNLLEIEGLLPSEDQQAFAAGFSAAVISKDWRIGVLSVSDFQTGTAARDAFLYGAEYFCGLCRPVYPPYFDANSTVLEYPTYFELPSAASSQEWLSAAQWLIDRPVEVVYITPGAGDQETIQAFANAGVNILSSSAPPSPMPASWAGTIGADPIEVLRLVLPGFLSGGPGPDSLPGLSISYANENIFTPGKQDLVNTLILELEAGRLETGPIP